MAYKINGDLEIRDTVKLNNLAGTAIHDIDLNNLNDTGIYYCGRNCINHPPGMSAWFYLEILDSGGNDFIQIARSVGDPVKTFIRAHWSESNNHRWSDWVETYDATKFNVYEKYYTNENIKKGEIYFFKIGQMVQVICTGDFLNLQKGVTIYIDNIDSKFTPVGGTVYFGPPWNNPNSYIFMRISGTRVSFANHSSEISEPTNGSFCGTYMSYF